MSALHLQQDSADPSKTSHSQSLPAFAPSLVKSFLTNDDEKYQRTLGIVSNGLSSVLRTLDVKQSQAQVESSRTLVSSYAKDVAKLHLDKVALAQTTLDVTSDELPLEIRIRKQVFALAHKLASVPDGLSLNTLLDLSVAYGPSLTANRSNTQSLRMLFAAATASTPSHLLAVSQHVIPTFTSALGNAAEAYTEEGLRNLWKKVWTLERFVEAGSGGSGIAEAFASDKDFLLVLAECYEAGLGRVATSFGGITTKNRSSEKYGVIGSEEWAITWMRIKVCLIGCLRSLLESETEKGHDRKRRARNREVISTLLTVAPPKTISSALRSSITPYKVAAKKKSDTKARPDPHTSPTTSVPFVTRSLLADYEHAYQLSKALATGVWENADTILITQLQDLNDGVERGDVGGLAILLKDRPIPQNLVIDTKGKGKAVADVEVDEDDISLEIAVTQVLEILPDQDPAVIRQCLKNSAFSGSAERVIAAFLEGGIPTEIFNAPSQNSDKLSMFPITDARKNVFDEFPLDYSHLRKGKKADTDTDAFLEDKSWMADIKAEILRKIEEASDSDDSEGGGNEKERIVAFEEELDDVVSIQPTGSVVDDGERSEVSEEDDDREEPPSAETILELAYIRNPKLFDRDAETRRSKQRIDLRAQTKLDDEQIEGWKIMLDRNPKKDKILQKHEFSGNKPLVMNAAQPAIEVSNTESRGGGHGRGGRGRGGTGRGRGSRADRGGMAHDRAWKDRHKARNANHDRKRGHDKKMARGGGPPL